MACARRLLPDGLISAEPPSVHHNEHMLRLHYRGEASGEAIAAACQMFHEETGWRLQLLLADKDTPQIHLTISQAEAIAQTWVLLSGASDLYRVEADAKHKKLWLYFHFPDRANPRYSAQFAMLNARTGWQVNLHPYAHQQALIELAYHLLLSEAQLSGRTTVYPERKVLVLTYEGHNDISAYEKIQQRFLDETGWRLELQPEGKRY